MYGNPPDWKQSADYRSFDDSVKSLTDAFNHIESLMAPLLESGGDLSKLDPGFEFYSLLSSDFITVYNECEYITDNYSARLNKEKLVYLYHLRNLCAHRFGTTMDTFHILEETAYVFLPMKESIRSMLLDALEQKEDSGPELEKRVRLFNIKSRR